MIVLVTGCNGFIGTHLRQHLESEPRIKVLGDRELVDNFDIRSQAMTRFLVEQCHPRVIFHLAAQSYVWRSFDEPHLTMEVNALGTLNLLEAVRQLNLNTRVVLASSSAVYGASYSYALTEDHPMQPLSPYGVSKAAMELIGHYYHRTYGLDIVRARIFGTIGPGKKGDAVADFCQRIARGERPLRVGNTETVRDLLDVRDTVRALTRLMDEGRSGEVYNICSGTGHRMWLILEQLVHLSGEEFEIVEDETLLRPADEPYIVGDPTKIYELGWIPIMQLHQTLEDTLACWREYAGCKSSIAD